MKRYVILFLTAMAMMSFTMSIKPIKKSFKVYGNCGMCEKKIEGALSDVSGIKWADWDVETKELEVKYDPDVITLNEIKQHIADIGYDTDSHRATDEAYENLHACCKYDRPDKK